MESDKTAALIRPVAIKMDKAAKVRVKRLAEARQRQSHALMREAITLYVDREDKQDSSNEYRSHRRDQQGFARICDLV